MLLSLIGIISVVLFFKQNSLSSKLIYFWLLAQIIIIEPYFDLSQSNVTISFSLGLKDMILKINFLPLFFLGFIKIMESYNLIGKEISLLKFRDNQISNSLPITGKIIKRIDFNNDRNWLLIQLNGQMEYEGKKIEKVFVKNKEDKAIKLKAKNQIAYLRLVTDESKINSTNVKEFPFIDWIRCE